MLAFGRSALEQCRELLEIDTFEIFARSIVNDQALAACVAREQIETGSGMEETEMRAAVFDRCTRRTFLPTMPGQRGSRRLRRL
jgi:hypothetical protein